MRGYRWLSLLAMGIVGNLGAECAMGDSRILLREEKDGWRVLDGEDPVLFYQRAPTSLLGRYKRAHYVHPLYDLDGHEVTEDFPLDHMHHRGVFWAWHQVWVGETRAGNAWICKDFVWDVIEVKGLDLGDGTHALKTHVLWKSPAVMNDAGEMIPFVKEVTHIRVHPIVLSHRKVDFEIKLWALMPKVRIGGSEDEKGYGGFSPRIVLPRDLRITGRAGEVEPRTEAVEAGPWMDFSGTFGKKGSLAGLAILCHPSLPQFPQNWILRRRGSMQNPVYPGREAVPLSQENPLSLCYRLILHRGDAEEARIDHLQAEYEEETLPQYE